MSSYCKKVVELVAVLKVILLIISWKRSGKGFEFVSANKCRDPVPNFVVESLDNLRGGVTFCTFPIPRCSVLDLHADSGWCHHIKGFPWNTRSPVGRHDHTVWWERLRGLHLSRVVLIRRWRITGSAARFLELDNKSPSYTEPSASPALVSVCFGCSLSSQWSAWGAAVNDGFVLGSPFCI